MNTKIKKENRYLPKPNVEEDDIPTKTTKTEKHQKRNYLLSDSEISNDSSLFLYIRVSFYKKTANFAHYNVTYEPLFLTKYITL